MPMAPGGLTAPSSAAQATPAHAARTSPGAQAVRAAHVATMVVFAAHALVFASWIAHLPLVKALLGLSDATLGLALFGTPIGSVVATLATGWLLTRLGSQRMVQLCLAGYCATGWAVGLAGSALQLFAALAVWGMFQGALDVSMNAQAIIVGWAAGRPVMSGFHGIWSLGSFTGAGLGAIATLGLTAVSALGLLPLLTAAIAVTIRTSHLLSPKDDKRPATAPNPTAR